MLKIAVDYNNNILQIVFDNSDSFKGGAGVGVVVVVWGGGVERGSSGTPL